MGEDRQVEVDGKELKLTNLDKVLYPKVGFTKGEMVDYYARIAEVMVPHLKGRPVTLRRFPEGVDGGSFFEKRCPKHRPKWVKTARMQAGPKAGYIDFCVCDGRPTLIWMAQLAAIELHPSLSLGKKHEQPTVLAFDLDPGPPADIVDCCRVALRLRALLDHRELESFVKTSGSKGMQLYVPLNTKVTYEETRPFAQALAKVVAKQAPDEVLAKMGKKTDRSGKVLIDWYQNNERKTTICVYSLRAREHPTVSTPITWDEVEATAESGDASELVFETEDVLKRIEKHGDLFAPVLELKQKLPEL